MNKCFTLFTFIFFFLSCGSSDIQGGSEFGNARFLVGSFSESTCPADTVIATNSLGTSFTAALTENCSFNLELPINTAYSLSFWSNGTLIANMQFINGINSLSSNTFVISASQDNMDLGIISLNGSLASPQKQPSSQNDQDQDGINDDEDDDDDNDGKSDDLEEDCDLDGFNDDLDENDDCDDSNDENEEEDSDSSDQAIILEVRPQNGSVGINLDQDIEVRFGCSLDTSTVNTENIVISDPSNNIIECQFEFENENTRLDCEHDDFLTLTQYTVTIMNLKCEDETEILSSSWSFTTK